MLEHVSDNQEKRVTYAILSTKLKKALQNEFYFEACLIEYAIIEDRLSSILQYSKVCKDAYNSNKKMSNKINSIKLQINRKHPILSKKVNIELLDEIVEWKDKRNDIVHRACVYKYNEDLVKDVAIKGNDLVRRLCNDSVKVTRLAKKLYGEEL